VSLDGGSGGVVLSEGADNLTELIADAIEELDKTHPDVTLVGTWISPTGVLYVDATVLVLGLEKAIEVAHGLSPLAGCSDLEALKAPYKLKSGDEDRTVESLKSAADAVVEAGRKGVEVQRYKGLGEMNPEQLWETTMNPETRTMLRVQIGSQEEAEEMFQKLMGDQVEPRRLFIEENALNVRNLDI